jgi:lycopene elongase/hydratase (dihydrobisanhydrobacterioruberin-forming)
MDHATAPGVPGTESLRASAPAEPTRRQPTLAAAIKTLHRFEVGPIYFFVLVWGMFVAARRPSDLWSAPAILAFFINGLSLFSGFVLNNYSDYPIDRRSQIKGYVADAVERVGPGKTFALYWIEQALTVAAAAAVSVLLHNWLFVVVKLVGIVSGMMYNAEPVRMKRRGIWNPVMLGIRFGFVPGMIAYLAVHGGAGSPGAWMLLVGVTLLSFSRGFWNSVSDTDEDRAEGILTPAVRYGPRSAMTISVGSLMPAIVLIGTGLGLLLGPPYAIVGVSGTAGAAAYRFLLLRRAHDDRGATALMRSAVRRTDARWAQATYWAITAAGLAHLITVS